MSKRDDIAQRVLGKLAARDAATPETPPRPRAMNTFIGQVGAQMTQGFAARVEVLERERADGHVVLKLDPKTVRFSHLANRHELSLKTSDADYKALKDDLRANGQEYPIKVKTIEGDAEHEFEVIAGHRRLQACRELAAEVAGGFPIFAILDGTAAELKVACAQDVPRERTPEGPVAVRDRHDVPPLAHRGPVHDPEGARRDAGL